MPLALSRNNADVERRKKSTMLDIRRGEAIRLPECKPSRMRHATHKILTNWHEQHVLFSAHAITLADLVNRKENG